MADGATAVFEAGTSLFTENKQSLAFADPQTLGQAGGSLSDVAGSLWAASPQTVFLIGTPAQQQDWVVGGVYLIGPEGASFSRPGTLTVKYSPQSLGTKDPATLRLYHFEPEQGVWRPVEASHDKQALAFTARFTETGAYCVGTDSTPPQFTLVWPSGSPAVVTTTQTRFVVGCTEDGTGLVPDSFRATIDGSPLKGTWSPNDKQAVLNLDAPLSPGTHTLSVAGADAAGNAGAADFEIQVVAAPAAAELTLAKAESNKVELVVKKASAQASETGVVAEPVAYEIWRTDPGPGLSFHRIARVKAGSGPSKEANFSDTDIQPGSTYSYVAVALSDQEVESQASSPLTVLVPPAPGGSETSSSLEPLSTSTSDTSKPGGAGDQTTGKKTKP
ncbi:MAG: hypothetical protein ACPLRM_04150, partial [Anaerolineae bacterium]